MTDIAKPKRTRKIAPIPENGASGASEPPVATPEGCPPTRSATVGGAKPASKADRILALLQRTEGATLQDLVAETGWQPHTARAALTGLRKKGRIITSKKTDGIRRYWADVPQ